MKAIDRLIIKAKKQYGDDRLLNAFIYPSETKPGEWIAEAHIWNGKAHTEIKPEYSTHDSEDAAIKAMHELAEKYPNSEDIRIFIDDIEVVADG